jgi:hypothetical protein
MFSADVLLEAHDFSPKNGPVPSKPAVTFLAFRLEVARRRFRHLRCADSSSLYWRPEHNMVYAREWPERRV